MIAAIFLESLEGYSDLGLHQTLREPDVAAALGVDPDDLPSRSTFTRARNDRFADCAESIERASEQVRRLAATCGSRTGPAFTTEDRGPSDRTRHRLLREKPLEVLEQMRDVMFPALSLPRADEPMDEDELLQPETHLAVQKAAANGGAVDYGDLLTPDADLGPEAPIWMLGDSAYDILGWHDPLRSTGARASRPVQPAKH
jgi:hypothetical protein